MTPPAKRYDRRYFEKHYRDRESRIEDDGGLRRRVKMVVGITEHVLGRSIRDVLDVGCGEARWLPHLRRLRRRVEYRGVDPSSYVVRAFGKERGIVRGGIDDVEWIFDGKEFDLVICADVLHYLPAAAVTKGLETIVARCHGVLFLDVTTKEDTPEGDLEGWFPRPASWYRDRFARAGLVHCGMQCWAIGETADRISDMERAEP